MAQDQVIWLRGADRATVLVAPTGGTVGKSSYACASMSWYYPLVAEKDKPEEPDRSNPSVIRPLGGVKVGAKAGLPATVTVRLIQSSPYADPKLVEEARKFERELKAQGLEEPIDPDREAPLILPVEK